MANIAYIRVSTLEQNTARQEEMFRDLKIDKYFIEKVSGKNIKDRPELMRMMDYVREGDTIIVESLSRFGRSLSDLLSLMEQLDKKSVAFKSLKEGQFDSTASGKLMFSIMSALAEYERSINRERQAEGIAIAKAEGKYKGRSRINVDSDQFEKLYKLWEEGGCKKKYVCKKLGISPSTFDRRVKDYRAANK